MDKNILEFAATWLLDAKNGESGWGKEYQGADKSITVTSEVVVALVDALPHLFNPTLRARTEIAITSGISYIKNALPYWRDPDLPNYASALIAFTKSSRLISPEIEFIQNECILKLFEFTNGNGWKTQKNDTHGSAFAAYLGMRALNILQNDTQLYTSLNSEVMEKINHIYNSNFIYLRDYVFLENGRIVDSSESISGSQEPALNSLWLHFRVCDFLARRTLNSPNQAINSFILNCLLDQETSIKLEWTYQLKHTRYQLCFLPYLVEALARYIEQFPEIDEKIHFFYHRLTLFMSSEEVQSKDSNCTPQLWWKKSKTDNDSPKVWVTAHFLTGLASVPLPLNVLATIFKLKEQNQILITDVDKCTQKINHLNMQISELEKSNITINRPSPWVIHINFWVLCLLCFIGIVIIASYSQYIIGVKLLLTAILTIIPGVIGYKLYERFENNGYLIGIIGIVITMLITVLTLNSQSPVPDSAKAVVPKATKSK